MKTELKFIFFVLLVLIGAGAVSYFFVYDSKLDAEIVDAGHAQQNPVLEIHRDEAQIRKLIQKTVQESPYIRKIQAMKDDDELYEETEPIARNIRKCSLDDFQLDVYEAQLRKVKQFNQLVIKPEFKFGSKVETYPTECKTLKRGCGSRHHGERFWQSSVREVTSIKKCEGEGYEIQMQKYEIEKVCLDGRVLTLEFIRPLGEIETQSNCKLRRNQVDK